MNWDIIEGKWDQLKGSVKQKWGDLTDDDLSYMAGSRDKVMGRMQERYGWTKDEAEKNVDQFFRDMS